jgi:hypothetical protein
MGLILTLKIHHTKEDFQLLPAHHDSTFLAASMPTEVAVVSQPCSSSLDLLDQTM